MAEAGLVQTFSEQEGNRPPRQVYAITEAGEAHFQRLLRRNLARYESRDSGDDIGVSYLLELPRADAAELLAQKQAQIRGLLTRIKTVEAHVSPADAIHLTLKRAIMQFQADLDWLEQVQTWLEQHQSTP